MLLLCYIISFVPKPSIFFFVLYNPMICDYDLCDYPMIYIISLSYFVTYVNIIHNITSHSLSNTKNKEKIKIKIKINRKIKLRKKSCIKVNIRELNRIFKYNIFTLYTPGCWSILH